MRNQIANVQTNTYKRNSDTNTSLSEYDKNRKNDELFIKNCVNKAKKSPKMSNIKKSEYNKIIEKTKLNVYARVLIDAFRNIPNIVKILDSIIETRASTISPVGPTGFSYNAFDDIEKVIALTDRKEKLINLYLIAKKMIKSLYPTDQDFLVKKFIQRRNIDDLAIELNINKRNIFRKSNSIITKLCYYLISQNWTADFIEMQIGDDEPWLKDLFKKRAEEYKANNKRAISATKK